MIKQISTMVAVSCLLPLATLPGTVFGASSWKVECQQGQMQQVNPYQFRCLVTTAQKYEYRAGTCSSPLTLRPEPYAGLSYSCHYLFRGKTTQDKPICRSGYDANPNATSANQTCRRMVPASQVYQAPYLKPL